MKKNKKYYLIFLFLFFLPKSFAMESINFLSLKNNEVNLRQGPSFKYPIKLVQRIIKPLLIKDYCFKIRLFVLVKYLNISVSYLAVK